MYRLIHDVYVQLEAADRLTLRDFGLSNSQYRLLNLLDTHRGQRLITLSDRILCARSTVTRMIDQLEEAGLVRRIPDPDDRRAQQVMLTEKGADLRQQAFNAHEHSLRERFAQLNGAEQGQLTVLLEKLRNSVQKMVELHLQGGELRSNIED